MPLSSVHDLEADALYITLREGDAARTVELDSGTLVDVDDDGTPLGLEVIHPHRDWPLDAFIRQFNIPLEQENALRVHARGFRTLTPSFRRSRKASSGSGRVTKLRPVAV